MRSDVTFTDFLKKGKGFIKPAVIVIIGILLLAIAAAGGGEEEYTEDELTREAREFCEAIDGVGECRIIISYESVGSSYYSSSAPKKVYAVAVACKGAKSVTVQNAIKELFISLYGIGANRVTVLPLD